MVVEEKRRKGREGVDVGRGKKRKGSKYKEWDSSWGGRQ